MMLQINSQQAVFGSHFGFCSHPYIIGDSFIQNCKLCGIFFPKSGSRTMRHQSHTFECDYFVSDLLRECYTKSLNRPQIEMPNPYKEIRGSLIDWLSQVGDQMRLSMKTLHQAIMILDLYVASQKLSVSPLKLSFSNYGNGNGYQTQCISREDYQLFALTSLFIAAKNLEKDDNIPKSGYLIKHMPVNFYAPQEVITNGCCSPKIIKLEREILKAINWNYEQYPTFYSVTEIFRSQGVIYDSDKVLNPQAQSQNQQELPTYNTVALVDKYIEFYSLLVLQDPQFVNINPYLITCAVISASRKSAGLVPIWPQELSQLSGLQINHFCNVTENIISIYKATFENKQPLNSANNSSEKTQSTSDSPNVSPQKTMIFQGNSFTEFQLTKITPDKIPAPVKPSHAFHSNFYQSQGKNLKTQKGGMNMRFKALTNVPSQEGFKERAHHFSMIEAQQQTEDVIMTSSTQDHNRRAKSRPRSSILNDQQNFVAPNQKFNNYLGVPKMQSEYSSLRMVNHQRGQY